jgi:hypothetical protein
MKGCVMLIRAAFLVLALCASGPNAVSAQADPTHIYPSHPITIVVSFAPGGATDVLPRRPMSRPLRKPDCPASISASRRYRPTTAAMLMLRFNFAATRFHSFAPLPPFF